jgi:pimeloyl-ACP methyl ester carboxylesterase
MRIAARRPELLRSLTLMDTTADPEPDENIPRYRAMSLVARRLGIGLVADRVMPIMYGKSSLSDPKLAKERASWRAHMMANRRSIWRAVNGVLERENFAPELSRISSPTFVLVGDEDAATGVDGAERIHRGISGSRFVRIPKAGHSAPVEQPEAVNDALRDFLESLGSG